MPIIFVKQNATETYYENMVYFLYMSNADISYETKNLSDRYQKGCVIINENHPIIIRNENKNKSALQKIIGALSNRLFVRVIILEESVLNYLGTDFEQLSKMDLGCPILIMSSVKRNFRCVEYSSKKENLIIPTETIVPYLNSKISKLGRFFQKSFLRKNLSICAFVAMSCICLTSAYIYGSFSYANVEDSIYQYVSKSIKESPLAAGHASYTKGEQGPLTYDVAKQLTRNASLYSTSYYTNFDITDVSEYKKRTYVASYIEFSPTASSTSQTSEITYDGENNKEVGVISLHDFGYANTIAQESDSNYAKFYVISLQRYKYIPSDWINKKPSEADAAVYISSNYADELLSDSDIYESYDDIIENNPVIDVKIGDTVIQGCVSNIIKSDVGQAPYITSYYNDFVLVNFPSAIADDFSISYCFDPSSSYKNVTGIANSTFVPIWEVNDSLNFYEYTGTDTTDNGWEEILGAGEKLENVYDGLAQGKAISNDIAFVFLSFLIGMALVSLLYFLFVFPNWIKCYMHHKIQTIIAMLFIIACLPIIIVQVPFVLIQFFSGNSLNSFVIFNYLGSSVSLYYFFGSLFLFVLSYIFIRFIKEKNNNSGESEYAKITINI